MADENNGNNKLSALERVQHERNTKMWDARKVFIQQGRRSLQTKKYSDAVVNYEKYIRILEIIFKTPVGGLTPEHFKESAKTSEMSVLAGVYWDLIRIYDTSPHYGERQVRCATQLAKFAPLTPIHGEIVKKAQDFMRTARHPEKVKVFLTAVGKSSRCFIATSAFQSANHADVITLRNYRDAVLKKTTWGRKFVYFYYRHSPQIACILDQHAYLKPPTRWALKLVIKCVTIKNKSA